VGLDAQELLDEALTRNSAQLARWFRRNSSLLQGALAVGLVTWSGWGLYTWRTEASRAKTSDVIAKALDNVRAEIGDPEKQGQPNEQGIIDPNPIFKDVAAREQATLAAFEAAVKQHSGTLAAAYAELGLAAAQLDAKKWDDALQHFEAVKNSAHAKADKEMRGRAQEGIALAQEGKGDAGAARKSYAELAGSEASNAAVGLYGEARLAHTQGDKPAAVAAITKLNALLAKKEAPEDPFGFSGGYLRQGAKVLSDVLGVAPEVSKESGTKQISADQLRLLQEEVQRKINQAGKKSE
jgi:predicted negative regulator of RcsB-dependent stress response